MQPSSMGMYDGMMAGASSSGGGAMMGDIRNMLGMGVGGGPMAGFYSGNSMAANFLAQSKLYSLFSIDIL